MVSEEYTNEIIEKYILDLLEDHIKNDKFQKFKKLIDDLKDEHYDLFSEIEYHNFVAEDDDIEISFLCGIENYKMFIDEGSINVRAKRERLSKAIRSLLKTLDASTILSDYYMERMLKNSADFRKYEKKLKALQTKTDRFLSKHQLPKSWVDVS